MMNIAKLAALIAEIEKQTKELGYYPQIMNPLNDAKDMIAQELRSECNKKLGRKDAARVIERILKQNRKDGNREAMNYAFTDNDGYQCVMNGYYIISLKEHLNLESAPEGSEAPDAWKGFFKDMPNHRHQVTLPEYSELKAYVKERIASRSSKYETIQWDFGENNPVVNAEYLLDIMTVFPNAKNGYCLENSGRLVRPMYISCDDGRAMILPIRTGKHWVENRPAAELAAEMAQSLIRDHVENVKANPDHAITFKAFRRMVNTLNSANMLDESVHGKAITA